MLFLGNKVQDLKNKQQQLKNIINEIDINFLDANNKSMDEGKDRSEKRLRRRRSYKEYKLKNKKNKKDKYKKVHINNFEIISKKYWKNAKN